MRYLITIIFNIVIMFALVNIVFSKEPFDTFDKIKGAENKIEFTETLSLREIVILGSQFVEKYGIERVLGFMTEVLGQRWAADYSSIAQTISIVLHEEKINSQWQEFIITNFKTSDVSLFFEDTEAILPFFIIYINDVSEDQKTKKVLLNIIECWFKGYRDYFTLPQCQAFCTRENFAIMNKQALLTLTALSEMLQHESESPETLKAARRLLEKIHQIYSDREHILPSKLKALSSFQQVKKKSEKLLKY
jgi:uncharacterized protein YecA (UPF0149 family)